MKTLLRLLLCLGTQLGLLSLPAFAQWQNPTYTLKGGWNSIYLHGDASHATPEALFAANPAILSVWRWNSDPTQAQFSQSSLIPSAGTPQWSVWVRGDATRTTLTSLTGPAAYLVECSGAASATTSLTLPQRILPPSSTWVRNGANFLGFPTRLASAQYPLVSSYFATFPVAIAANTHIYKYVGGPLGEGNPIRVFSPSFERLDRNQAYWFDAAVVGSFHAPIEITPSHAAGLVYGRTGSERSIRVYNRSSAPVTLTITPTDSVAAPAGQVAITGPVPLLRRTLDAATGAYTETPITAAFSQVVAPQASVDFSFVVNRASLTGANGAFYASFLRFTDAGNLLDISVPLSAQVASLAGLWVGEIAVNAVDSTVAGSGATTAKSFPLRVLLHIDDAGQARLLSQVFLGKLAAGVHELGVCTREDLLLASAKADAVRFVAAHLPPDAVLELGNASNLGATLTGTLNIAFDAPTNPFVHAYHPDHDNRNARGADLPAGVESPAISRTITFALSATPPVGTSSVGWGSSVIGGAYSETLTGLHKNALKTRGPFTLRRLSEIGVLTQP